MLKIKHIEIICLPQSLGFIFLAPFAILAHSNDLTNFLWRKRCPRAKLVQSISTCCIN